MKNGRTEAGGQQASSKCHCNVYVEGIVRSFFFSQRTFFFLSKTTAGGDTLFKQGVVARAMFRICPFSYPFHADLHRRVLQYWMFSSTLSPLKNTGVLAALLGAERKQESLKTKCCHF